MSEWVGDFIAQIATAANQQSTTAREINGSIERIATSTAGSAAGAQQRIEALRDLSALASGSATVGGQFRLEAETNDSETRKPASGHPRTGQNPSRTRSPHA
jgi:hypothetical protein